MLAQSEVDQISSQLSTGNVDNEEISRIIYRIDVYKAGNERIISRHVDIEYTYGEYYEICENTALFQYISTVHYLLLFQEDQEIVLYQK